MDATLKIPTLSEEQLKHLQDELKQAEVFFDSRFDNFDSRLDNEDRIVWELNELQNTKLVIRENEEKEQR